MPDDPILRLIDANLNRAREGMRVMEDYTRFVLNHFALGERLKTLRQRLATATQAVAADAIFARDVAGDVGTTFSIENAPPRETIADVVTAAGKRVGEAIRVVEECLKTIDAHAAREVEAIRYMHYDNELLIARTLAPADARLAGMRLYVIVTEAQCAGRPWMECARAALAGGADVVQLREKEMEAGELLRRAKILVAMCREAGAVSIINDRPDVALLGGADGVHVGQGDLPPPAARKIIGAGKIVGLSTHTIEQARAATLEGVDYIGVGPIFKSTTKPREFVSGLEFARQVAAEVRLPAVAIAGVTAENVGDVIATGMTAVAVTSAVMSAPSVEAATRTLKAGLSGIIASAPRTASPDRRPPLLPPARRL